MEYAVDRTISIILTVEEADVLRNALDALTEGMCADDECPVAELADVLMAALED